MPEQDKENFEYVEAESIGDLTKKLMLRMWAAHGQEIVRDARGHLGWLVRYFPPRLLERLLAYGMARAVGLILTAVVDGSIEFYLDKKEAGAKGDGEVSR